MEINVKILLSRGMEMPAYATDGSAAVDLRAALEEGEVVTLLPGERYRFPTGVAISPERRDVVAVVAGRSGHGRWCRQSGDSCMTQAYRALPLMQAEPSYRFR